MLYIASEPELEVTGDVIRIILHLKFLCLKQLPALHDSLNSSVTKVSDYGLDDRAIDVQSPAEADELSCNLCVQTRLGAHPGFCPMGTGGPFNGGKARPGRDADKPHPSSAEVNGKS
jgi:hypothetical protein